MSFVSVRLPTNERAVLATNLHDAAAYPTEKFGALDHRRRGRETFSGPLKGRLELENVSGQTPRPVRQDFFATLPWCNLENVLTALSEAATAQAAGERGGPGGGALQGRPLKLVDGSTVTLSDTPKIRAVYPAVQAPPPSCPLMFLVVLWVLGSGAVLALAEGSLSQSELARFGQLRGLLAKGDIFYRRPRVWQPGGHGAVTGSGRGLHWPHDPPARWPPALRPPSGPGCPRSGRCGW